MAAPFFSFYEPVIAAPSALPRVAVNCRGLSAVRTAHCPYRMFSRVGRRRPIPGAEGGYEGDHDYQRKKYNHKKHKVISIISKPAFRIMSVLYHIFSEQSSAGSKIAAKYSCRNAEYIC